MTALATLPGPLVLLVVIAFAAIVVTFVTAADWLTDRLIAKSDRRADERRRRRVEGGRL